MNLKAQQQLIQFLSTTIAVALGVILAMIYLEKAEEKKPKKIHLIQIENWEGFTKAV